MFFFSFQLRVSSIHTSIYNDKRVSLSRFSTLFIITKRFTTRRGGSERRRGWRPAERIVRTVCPGLGRGIASRCPAGARRLERGGHLPLLPIHTHTWFVNRDLPQPPLRKRAQYIEPLHVYETFPFIKKGRGNLAPTANCYPTPPATPGERRSPLHVQKL